MPIWTYQGEAGKALDATVRPFAVEAARCRFAALEADVLSWVVKMPRLVPNVVVPEEGQLVTLYRNGSRFFRGRALRPQQAGHAMACAVEGPWQWMEREPLSSAVTLHANSGGGTGARASYAFPAQSMTVSLTTLINRMIALGAPFTLGTIATTFSCLPVTLKQGSFAAALTELVRLIGDMAVWFDYSGTGNPSLNITRRLAGLAAGSAETVTIDARDLEPGGLNIVPQDELRVAQVRVPYLDRATNGSRRYQEQKSGTAEAGHVLLLTASGDELDTFLPDEKLDSVNLQTIPTNSTPAQFLTFLNAADPVLAKLRAKWGFQWYGANVVGQYLTSHAVANGSSLPYHNSAPSGSSVPAQFATTAPAVKINGVPIAGTKHIISNDATVPEWMRTENEITVYEAELVSEVYVTLQWDQEDFPGGQPNIPGLIEFAGESGGVQNRWNTFGSAYERVSHFVYTSAVRVKLIDTAYSALTTVYRTPEYQFIAPPSGFAAGLLAARDWTPHKGSLAWKEAAAGGTRYLGKMVNVTNADPEWATMKAMIQSEELDLFSGVTRLQLGAPARLAFPSLLDQVRTHSNNQITFA
jgi:hypothetical protein